MDIISRLFPGPLSFTIWGMAGSAVIALGCVIPALPYRGRANERYSPLNHYISELGELEVSVLARFFNICLVVSGILFAVFNIGFGRYYATTPAIMAAAAGVYSSFACTAVGLFPMNRMSRHMVAAISFFYGGLVTIVLFGVTAAVDTKKLLPPVFIIFAAAVTLAFVSFLLLPRLGGRVFSLDPSESKRPRIWMLPLLEWLLMLGITGWVLSVSFFFMGRQL